MIKSASISNKKQIIQRFIMFSTYGHFMRDGQKKEIIFNSIFSASIWLGITLVFSGVIFSVSAGLFKWIGIVAVIRMLSSSLECNSDVGIDYTLSCDYPVSSIRVFWWRVISKCLQINEWVYCVCTVYVFYCHLHSFVLSAVLSLLSIISLGLLEETTCLISYQTFSRKVFYWLETLLFVAVLAVSFFLLPVCSKKSLVILFSGLASFSIAGFLFHSSKGYIGAYASRSRRLKSRQTSILKHRFRTAKSVFLRKEFSFLFKVKLDILLSAASLSLFLIFTTKRGDIFIPFLPAFFILDFASSYAFNYLGAEKSDFLITLLSPIDYRYIIRAKTISICIVSVLGGAILMIPMIVFSKISSFDEIFQIIAVNNLSTAITLVVGSYLSIRYFHGGKRNPYFIVELIITICLYALLAAFILFLSIINCSTAALLIISFLFFGISFTVTIVIPDCFADYLCQREPDILLQFSRE